MKIGGLEIGKPGRELIAAAEAAGLYVFGHSTPSDRDRSGEADETRNAAQPEARAQAEGIAQPSPEASS